MNPAEIFSEFGKKIFKKTLKKMFENEVHCFLTTQCFQLLNCIELHRIASHRIVFYQHASFLVSYRAHVSRYESDRLCHERFTPLKCMFVCVCKHGCMFVCVCKHVCMFVCVCKHGCMFVCVCKHGCMFVCVCKPLCLCVFVYRLVIGLLRCAARGFCTRC